VKKNVPGPRIILFVAKNEDAKGGKRLLALRAVAAA
jgi:hypothetical protein